MTTEHTHPVGNGATIPSEPSPHQSTAEWVSDLYGLLDSIETNAELAGAGDARRYLYGILMDIKSAREHIRGFAGAYNAPAAPQPAPQPDFETRLGNANFDGLAVDGRAHICRVLIEARHIDREIGEWLSSIAEGKDVDSVPRAFEIQRGFLGEALEKINEACADALADLMCIEENDLSLSKSLQEGSTNGS